MDYSFDHLNQGEVMGVQNRFTEDFQSHVHNFEETDIKGDNNLFNSFKTDTNTSCNSDSLLEDEMITNGDNYEVDNSVINYSFTKTAMDLSIHNRVIPDNKKSIFEDAEYFSKNYMYKLLPITFGQVDETIIATEHNYCNFFMSSESDMEEDCSRTMDYSQIKEKNYKRRKTKCSRINNGNDCKYGGLEEHETSIPLQDQIEEMNGMEIDHEYSDMLSCTEPCATQPLDLSTPLVQEDKTDHCLTEQQSSIIPNSNKVDEKEDGGEFDSDKENLKSNSKCIKVTITRPGAKENYEPCDLFLNDIARLVPRLVRKDCFEIDILDKTRYPFEDMEKHRLYYVISESTWRLFQNATERIILTNDQSLGQRAQETEKGESQTFLVFDQFSLAQSLADYCKEIGGCFEYNCVEETRKEEEQENVQLRSQKEINTEEADKSEKIEKCPEIKTSKDESPETDKETEKKRKRQAEEREKIMKLPKCELRLYKISTDKIYVNKNKNTKAENSKSNLKDKKTKEDSKAVKSFMKGKTVKTKRSPIVNENNSRTKAVVAFNIRTRSKSCSEPENGYATSQKSDKISPEKKLKVPEKQKAKQNAKRPQAVVTGSIEIKTRSGKVLKDAVAADVKSLKKTVEVLKNSAEKNSKGNEEEKKKALKKKSRRR